VLLMLAGTNSMPAQLSLARTLEHLAWNEETRVQLTAAGAVKAMRTLVDSPMALENVLESVAKAACYLSVYTDQTSLQTMVSEGIITILVNLHANMSACMDEKIDKSLVCLYIAHALRGITLALGGPDNAAAMSTAVGQGIIQLLCVLTSDPQASGEDDTINIDMVVDLSTAFCNVSFHKKLRTKVLSESGACRALLTLARPNTADGNWRAAAALRFLAIEEANRLHMVSEKAVQTLSELANRPSACMRTKRECAAAICSLADSTDDSFHEDSPSGNAGVSPDHAIRGMIVVQGALPTLIKLSQSTDPETVKSCSIALSNLSTASASVDEGTVGSLIAMALTTTDLPDFLTSVDNDDKPPPLQIHGMEAPDTDVAQDVCVVHDIQDQIEKQSAGMAGDGPPLENLELMEAGPLPFQGQGGDADGDESKEEAYLVEKSFPKIELQTEMAGDLLA